MHLQISVDYADSIPVVKRCGLSQVTRSLRGQKEGVYCRLSSEVILARTEEKESQLRSLNFTVEETQATEGKRLFQNYPNSKWLHKNPECLDPILMILRQTDSLLYVCACFSL